MHASSSPIDQRLLTQAVVGQPFKLRLGKIAPVGQATLMLRLPSKASPFFAATKLQFQGVRWNLMAAFAGAAAITAMLAYQWPSPTIVDVPMTTPVSTLAEKKPEPQKEQPLPEVLSSIGLSTQTYADQPERSPLPSEPEKLFGQAASSKLENKQSLPKASPTLATSATVTAKQARQQVEPSPAVILDATAKSVQAQAPAVSGVPIKIATPVRDTPAVQSSSSSAGAQRNLTIVDIAKDNSFVLITNPSTRLPEKMTAGAKLYTGETIRKIDHARGEIQTDSRTVQMQ
jgi:hypothetical protein